jgi:hypothetical protein
MPQSSMAEVKCDKCVQIVKDQGVSRRGEMCFGVKK